MIFVVDASIAVKWFVRENLHDEAHRLLDHRDALTAPDLIVAEIANVAWKKAIRGEISRDQAQAIATEISQHIPAFYPSADLIERALKIALDVNHTVYDCLYIACAEAVSGVLVTADERLVEAVENTELAPFARYIGDPDFF